MVLVGLRRRAAHHRTDYWFDLFLVAGDRRSGIVGVFALFPFSLWQMELIVFAVTTTGLSIWAPRYVKPWIHKTQTDHMNLNDRGAQKIGRKGSVWKNHSSMVQAKCVWAIRCGLLRARRGMDIEEGVQVEVIRAEGTKLFVKSIQSTS